MKTLPIIIGLTALGLSAAMAAQSMSVTKPVADPGSYAGFGNGRALTFFVPPGSRSVLNISMPATGLTCSPGGGGIQDFTFVLPKAALGRNGSFGVKTSRSGFLGGYPTRFSYSLAGRFSKATKQHTATAAGSFREDIRYTNNTGVHVTCTTNNQSWTASRSGSIPKPKSLVSLGNYAGVGGGQALAFAVAPSRVNTISMPYLALTCSPGGGGTTDSTFNIPQAVVRPDGSFSATTSRSGVFGGASATFSYLFSGNFQGKNANGVGSAAGVFREDVVFTDAAGVHRTCTTNTQAWTATRSS